MIHCYTFVISKLTQRPTNIPAVGYELPDGHTIECGPERFTIPELLFNPKPLNVRLKFDHYDVTDVMIIIRNERNMMKSSLEYLK